MKKNSLCLWLLVLSATSSAQADQLTVRGSQLPNAKIVGFKGGRLQFHAADGSLQDVWIDTVEFIQVDRGGLFIDFNDAERLLVKDDAEGALQRYRRAQRLSEDFWSELMDCRMLLAVDRPESTDQAATTFLKVVRGKFSGVPAAARLLPIHAANRKDAKVLSALEALDSALTKAPTDDQRMLIEGLRYDLLRRIGDARAASAARSLGSRLIPSSTRCDRADRVMLEALEEALTDGATAEESSNLASFIREGPDDVLVGALILKGELLNRTASTREEIVRACWPFLRVAIHFPKDPRAADGLYGAAVALDRLGERAKARELLRECLAHPVIAEDTRRRADMLLASYGSGNG